MKYDAVALGEYLIDFTPHGLSESGQLMFERNPGGAPVNVLAAMAKLGMKTGFIGKVGTDPFGVYLRQALLEQGVSDSGLVVSDEAHTTMAFIHLDEQGERSFHFSRKPGADQLLREDEVDPAMLEGTRIFHFGSISMTAEPSYTATIQSAQRAKASGVLISYDPNWRPSLWENEQHARETIQVGLSFADIVKVSDEEIVFLTGQQDLELASRQLMERYSIQLLLVTAGAKGSFYRMSSWWGLVDSFSVQTIDTTGAGDGFFGAFLFRIVKLGKSLLAWSEEDLCNALIFANAAGALAATRKGAIPSLGTLEEINTLIREGE
ncbi:sugar kinase [Paenibacillus ferrarius]|uniref:Sugar kinase n=1 Tax=Paenibacillus ferrarius TaxID=1469647 RepID=A0A1V4H9Z8_9BACL|nr:PfkB family carbohydrate kinase [Paenibacillus ferrarius]OPH48197.1 sugar kinase [Paenibacillus ferrarius]